jgi:hypothetical protein
MIRRLVGAGALLAAAVFLVLVARDAWHWQRAIRDADARAALGYVSPEAWRAHTTLPAGLTRGLLAIDDDLAFRSAAMDALRENAHTPTPQQQRARSIVESELVRISRGDADPARAASAADDLGVLLYFDPPSPSNAKNPYEAPGQAPASGEQSPAEKALAEFELAVRLDPSNATAQRNLEVLLRQTKPPSKEQTPRAGAGERYGAKGSGARLPGHGY